jgi:uncharacterized membrane protein
VPHRKNEPKQIGGMYAPAYILPIEVMGVLHFLFKTKDKRQLKQVYSGIMAKSKEDKLTRKENLSTTTKTKTNAKKKSSFQFAHFAWFGIISVSAILVAFSAYFYQYKVNESFETVIICVLVDLIQHDLVISDHTSYHNQNRQKTSQPN